MAEESEAEVEVPWWKQHYVISKPASYDQLRMHINIMHAVYVDDIDLKTKDGKESIRECHQVFHARPALGHISHEHR